MPRVWQQRWRNLRAIASDKEGWLLKQETRIGYIKWWGQHWAQLHENRFVYFAATMRRPRAAADGAALGGLGGGFEQPLRLSVYGGGETASGAGAAALVRERALSATVAWRGGGGDEDDDAACAPFALWGTELLEYDRCESRRDRGGSRLKL